MKARLTGRNRVRSDWINGKQVLILQVQYTYSTSPITGWRDATVEDITVGLELSK